MEKESFPDMAAIKQVSLFPGIKRNLDSLGKEAQNILTQNVSFC